LQLAAADPTGDPILIRRAAERLDIPADAAAPAAGASLAEFGVSVRFRHPLVRSAAYRSMPLWRRQEVHQALAEATDAEVDPDRRAWHRAQAASGPDEDVAAELERSADRAQARGGLAAAAAFHQRAAELTPEPARRAQRLLAAAGAKRDAGALDESLELLVAAQAGPWNARRSAEVERLRGQIAFDQRRYGDAAPLLLKAARRLEPVDAAAAREAHLEALLTAMWAGGQRVPGDLRKAGEAARAAPRGCKPPRAVDLLLDAFALLLTEGYSAAFATMRQGLDGFLALNIGADEVGGWLWRAGSRAAGIAALELWDYECWHRLASEQVLFARDTGALVHLQSSLGFLGWTHVVAGELDAAALLVKESRLVAEATAYSPIAHTAMMLAAWRGQVPSAFGVIEGTVRDLRAGGLGTVSSTYASSVLYNGLGRYEEARDAARQAFECHPVGYGPLIVSEMAEAASRTGDLALVRMALEWLKERTRFAPSEWALGIEARVAALLSDGEAADDLYRQSIERLGHTRVRAELARSRLLYGEWLRRENRRSDAREPLRAAHEMLLTMGIEAFAERARRELLATGGKVRKRTLETRDDLTAQEEQIARLARAGLSNPEIGARLFLSPRTVEWHLRKVFTKLEIHSRRELLDALPISTSELAPGLS
jgi:DNA-binding CsgD family transcriptional regulator